jgi:hypothetical protein
VARVRRRYRCTTMSDHDQPIAPNLLARRFEAGAPNQRRVGEITEPQIWVELHERAVGADVSLRNSPQSIGFVIFRGHSVIVTADAPSAGKSICNLTLTGFRVYVQRGERLVDTLDAPAVGG